MGILNVTPDSFSDGGNFYDPHTALAHANRLLEDGAHILDIGAESTRPGFEAVSAEDEWARLAPVLNPLLQQGTLVSVDTTKASVARASLKQGVQIINDIWGLQSDSEMPFVIADSAAHVVVMHNALKIDAERDIIADWKRFFDVSLNLAEKAGIAKERLILDPGIGFAKTPAQNIQAIRSLKILKSEYQLPILLGLSRKSMFGHFLGRSVKERLAGTLAANIAGVHEGADILRVHDIREHADAFKMYNLINEGL
ncbi:dihydropteroate synthase [Swingsia samuiensis]|uniref:dihydropteroate synthase n=2 Tax=Swingsia samuiensis TaxID=1293412 RepID=A0A4Y6UK66_9PROT|nr:dihydropteroate synthase [Swingsia samuiensis]